MMRAIIFLLAAELLTIVNAHIQCNRSQGNESEPFSLNFVENFCIGFCGNASCSNGDSSSESHINEGKELSGPAKCLIRSDDGTYGNPHKITSFQRCLFPCILELNLLNGCDAEIIVPKLLEICPHFDLDNLCLEACLCCQFDNQPTSACVSLCLSNQQHKIEQPSTEESCESTGSCESTVSCESTGSCESTEETTEKPTESCEESKETRQPPISGATRKPPVSKATGKPPVSKATRVSGRPPVTRATGATGKPPVSVATGASRQPPVSGATGATGRPPVSGATDAYGQTAVSGATGASGRPPVTGVTGVTGATGKPPVTGATGASGRPPVTGATGGTGQPPIYGTTGATRRPPVSGSTGATGQPPVYGTTGATGRPASGATGQPQVTAVTGKPSNPTSFTSLSPPTSTSGPFRCSEPGFYPDSTSCTDYYLCKDDLIANKWTCPAGFYFSKDLLVCDWDNVGCGDVTTIGATGTTGKPPVSGSTGAIGSTTESYNPKYD